MTTHVFRSFKAIAKRLTVLFVSVVMFLSLAQTAVLAASSQPEIESSEAGSFVVPGITEPVPDENIGEMKEQRREWQSKVSASNDTKAGKSNSLGETVKEKLNLDEITEGYKPGESEKTSKPGALESR